MSIKNTSFKKSLIDWLNRHDLAFAAICAVVIIGVGGVLGWYNNKVVPTSTNPIAHYLVEPSNKLSFLSNWDGPDYITIATAGYRTASEASFFPLYPILIHLVHYIIASQLDSALVVSWLCLIGAIYFYARIIKKLYKVKNNTDSVQGLLYFLLFPTGIFLIASYSESLFALLALAAISSALEFKYIRVAIFSLLCCLTHLDGIFVLALVCLILLENKVKLTKVVITGVCSLVGVGGYSLYLWKKFNRPLAFILEQQKHGWLNRNYSELFNEINALNILLLILIVVAVIYWWRRKRSFAIYSLLFLLIPLIGNQFGGFNRYVLMDFPMQFMAYDYLRKRPLLLPMALCLVAIIWSYTALQYTGGYIGG